MESYEINKNTCAIVSVDKEITKVVESNHEYYINQTTYEIMDNSCQYYGSSCDGRIKGTKMILGSGYKVPIVVEESNDIIFFPTESPNSISCSWLSLNQIARYEDSDGYTKVTFNNGKYLIVKISTASFENQILRANRLESLLKKRTTDERIKQD